MIHRVLQFVLLISLVFVALTNAQATKSVEPMIRILVVENVREIRVSSEAMTVSGGKKKSLRTFETTIIPTLTGFYVGEEEWKSDDIRVTSKDKRIWVNGKPYGGIVTIHKNKRRLLAINHIPIEEYLKGLLPGEMPSGWPLEALKAQAVAARTYALYVRDTKIRGKSKDLFDLRATVEDQVFTGKPNSHPNINRAVDETRAEILMYHSKPIKTRFHSTCGGKTETSIHVWGENDISQSISDPYCRRSPHSRWQKSLSGPLIASRLKKHGIDIGTVESIRPETIEKSGRIGAVSLHGNKQTVSLTGNDFRRYIGFDTIKSTLTTITKDDDSFLFSGQGFGHGVGMCQWGAKGMAGEQKSYRNILDFYYPGTEIQKSY